MHPCVHYYRIFLFVKNLGICRFVTFVIIGNRLLQAFGVIALSYYSWTVMVYKTKKIENLVRQFFLFIIGGLIILEMIFALPPAMNLQGSDHLRKYFT